MRVTETNIQLVKPHNGLVGFASLVVDDWLYLAGIGVHQKLNGGFRLVFPAKTLNGQHLHFFHPIQRDSGQKLEAAIVGEISRLLTAV